LQPGPLTLGSTCGRYVPEAMKYTKPKVSKVGRRPLSLPPSEVLTPPVAFVPCHQVLPLRSLFLDPKGNTLPPAKTQTELIRNVRERNFAHATYDIVSV
jgi:hypothetical protein